MEILAMSSSGSSEGEIEEVIKMFEAGLRCFHVRKPKMSHRELRNYLSLFPFHYRNRLVLHTYHGLAYEMGLGGIHLSRSHRKRARLYRLRLWLRRKANPNLTVTRTFHKLTDLGQDKRVYSYTFLSPVFDSVSQNSLSGGYSRRALLIMIPQARQPVYAMGGVRPDNIGEVASLGFSGAVLLGALWKSDVRPSTVYKAALEAERAAQSK